jgi:hypothetical protein
MFSSCTYSQFKEPEYVKISNCIVLQYSQELADQKKIFLDGSGGAMMDDIQRVTVSYISNAELSLEQARTLYINVMQEYLERYNANEKIRPYLHNFPFTAENIDLKLSFEKESGQRQCSGDVAFVFMVNNVIYYDSYNNEKSTFYSLHKEAYADALKIVKNG